MSRFAVGLLDLTGIRVPGYDMDFSVRDNDGRSSVVITENISGCTADADRHGRSLDLKGFVVIQFFGNFKIQAALGQLQFQFLAVLKEFCPAVRLKGNDLAVIKSDRGKSVETCI